MDQLSACCDVVLETRVLVSRRLEDKNESLGLGLGSWNLSLVLVLKLKFGVRRQNHTHTKQVRWSKCLITKIQNSGRQHFKDGYISVPVPRIVQIWRNMVHKRKFWPVLLSRPFLGSRDQDRDLGLQVLRPRPEQNELECTRVSRQHWLHQFQLVTEHSFKGATNYGNRATLRPSIVAVWLAGWLSVTAGIVSKRLNLS